MHQCTIAGAGCGKTTALVKSVQQLLDNNVNPKKITIMTFTCAATDEIKKRLNNSLLNIGTIDCLSLQCISKWAPELLRNIDSVGLYKVAWLSFLKRQNCPLKNNYLKHITHLFVDEYQDIMCIYDAIVEILAANKISIYVIGDPAQCIYTFNDANSKYLQYFPKKYLPCKINHLTINYRSTTKICEIATCIIDAMELTNKPSLLASNQQTVGNCIIHQFNTFEEEINFISNNIIATDSVILTRTVASQDKFYTIITEKIKISTIHKSKGLEYDTVFLPQLTDDELPYKSCYDLEEELRLFYVAITRAKKHIYITYVGNKCSRFLKIIWDLMTIQGNAHKSHCIELPRKSHEINKINKFIENIRIGRYLQLYMLLPKNEWVHNYIYPPKPIKWEPLFKILFFRRLNEAKKICEQVEEPVTESDLLLLDSCNIPRNQIKIVSHLHEKHKRIIDAYSRLRDTTLNITSILSDALTLYSIFYKNDNNSNIPINAISKLENHIGKNYNTKVDIVYKTYSGQIDLVREDESIILLTNNDAPEKIDYTHKLIAFFYAASLEKCNSIEYVNLYLGWSYRISLENWNTKKEFIEALFQKDYDTDTPHNLIELFHNKIITKRL